MAAREETTGIEATIAVKPSYGLSDAEIATMLKDSFAHAATDMQIRALTEAQVDADQIATAIRAALTVDGALLDVAEQVAIEEEMERLAAVRAGSNHMALRAAVESVNRATAEFAQRRMDRSVARALKGQRIDALSD